MGPFKRTSLEELQEDLRYEQIAHSQTSAKLEDLQRYVESCSAMIPGEGLLAVKIEKLLEENKRLTEENRRNDF